MCRGTPWRRTSNPVASLPYSRPAEALYIRDRLHAFSNGACFLLVDWLIPTDRTLGTTYHGTSAPTDKGPAYVGWRTRASVRQAVLQRNPRWATQISITVPPHPWLGQPEHCRRPGNAEWNRLMGTRKRPKAPMQECGRHGADTRDWVVDGPGKKTLINS